MKTKLTLLLASCLLLAGTSFAQVYVPLVGPSVTSIQFKNNGVNYGAAISGGGSINLAPGCTASGTSPNFTITCTASGTVNPGTATHLAYYATSAAAVNDMGPDFTFNTHTLAGGASSILDLSAGTLKPPGGGGTLTLGTANINWATLGTGIVINTTTTGAKSVIAAVGAKCYPFQGSGGTGCDTPTGAGTVNPGTATHLAYYASSTNAVSDMGADYTFNAHTLAGGASSIFDLSAGNLRIPQGASDHASPTLGSPWLNTTYRQYASFVGYTDNASSPNNLNTAFRFAVDDDSSNMANLQYFPLQVAKIEKAASASFGVWAATGDSNTAGITITKSYLYELTSLLQSTATGWGSAGPGWVSSNSLKNPMPAGVSGGGTSGSWSLCGWADGTLSNGHGGACWGPDRFSPSHCSASFSSSLSHSACLESGLSRAMFRRSLMISSSS